MFIFLGRSYNNFYKWQREINKHTWEKIREIKRFNIHDIITDFYESKLIQKECESYINYLEISGIINVNKHDAIKPLVLNEAYIETKPAPLITFVPVVCDVLSNNIIWSGRPNWNLE